MAFLKERIELSIEEAELRASQAFSRYPKQYFWLIVLFFILLIPGYFAVKYFSHTYWENSYKNSEVVARPSFTDPKPPLVGNFAITTVGSDAYAAAVEVSNENLDLSLPITNYQIKFYSQDQSVVNTVTGKFFLLPNERKYIVVSRVVSGDKKITSAELVLPETLAWQRRVDLPKVTFSIQQPTFYNQPNPAAFTVEGTFQNQSHYELKEVTLTILLYDSAGKILGASTRVESTIAPLGLRSYKLQWPGIYTEKVVRVQVFAGTNTLDENAVTLPKDTSPSSGLGR